MVVTQENIIKKISEREDINVATVRKIFKTAEEVVFDYLSSTSSTHKTVVKVLDGLSIECKYKPKTEINTFKKISCNEKIWAKPRITRYYNRKLNKYIK